MNANNFRNISRRDPVIEKNQCLGSLPLTPIRTPDNNFHQLPTIISSKIDNKFARHKISKI